MAKFPTPKKFTPRNPKKYAGDPSNIIARSNLENRVFKYLDMNPQIAVWASEEIYIPYVSPLDDPSLGKMHRYFIDVIIKTSKGEIFFVEIKPDSQTRPPKKSKNTKRYLREVSTWLVNEAKWEAAKIYAEKRGGKFITITEKDIGGYS